MARMEGWDVHIGFECGPEGRRLLRRPRRRWENKIKMALKEIGWGNYGLMWSGSEKGKWWALVNSFVFHKMQGIPWLSQIKNLFHWFNYLCYFPKCLFNIFLHSSFDFSVLRCQFFTLTKYIYIYIYMCVCVCVFVFVCVLDIRMLL